MSLHTLMPVNCQPVFRPQDCDLFILSFFSLQLTLIGLTIINVSGADPGLMV
jgi:hypothetical protein